MEFSITPDTCRICLENKKGSLLLKDPYPTKKIPKTSKLKLQCYWDVYKYVAEMHDSPKLIHPSPSSLFFPERICKRCITQLHEVFVFHRKVLKSENVLKHLIDLYGHQSDKVNELETQHDSNKSNQEIECMDDEIEGCSNLSATSDTEVADNLDTANIVPTIETENRSKSPLFKGRPVMSQCEDCGKMIQTRYFKKHSESHSGEYKKNQWFPCDLCDRQYAFRGNLIKHKRIHFNDKRYTCPYCNEKFLYKGTCKYHILSRHTGERPYVCEICGKGFRHVSQKYIHVRQHTGVTPYACEICDRRFISLQSMKTHQLSHTDAKDFHCNVCGKSYKSKKTLQVHTRTLHDQEKNYVCVICNRAFSHNHVLRAHQLKNHPKYKPPPSGTIVSIRAIDRMKEPSTTVIKNVSNGTEDCAVIDIFSNFHEDINVDGLLSNELFS